MAVSGSEDMGGALGSGPEPTTGSPPGAQGPGRADPAEDDGAAGRDPGAPPSLRLRATVAAAILLPLLVPGVMMSRSVPALAVGDGALLLLVFGGPALLLRSLRDLRRYGLLLLGAVLAGTLAWDAWTAFGLERRPFLSEWPLVYLSSLIVFFLLYLIQAAVVGAFGRRAAREG